MFAYATPYIFSNLRRVLAVCLVSLQLMEEVATYQRFVSIHAHHLLEEWSVSIIQLALSQPESSIVYQQALRLAKQETLERSAFYVRLW